MLRSFRSFFQATHYAKRQGSRAFGANEVSFGSESKNDTSSFYQIKITHNNHGERIVHFKRQQEQLDVKQVHQQVPSKKRHDRVARRLNNKAPPIGSNCLC